MGVVLGQDSGVPYNRLLTRAAPIGVVTCRSSVRWAANARRPRAKLERTEQPLANARGSDGGRDLSLDREGGPLMRAVLEQHLSVPTNRLLTRAAPIGATTVREWFVTNARNHTAVIFPVAIARFRAEAGR